MAAFWDFGPTPPTQEELLRGEYPDLMEKWNVYQKCKERFDYIEPRLSWFTWFERIFKTRSYVFTWRMVEIRKRKMTEAFNEYEMLKKLLEDHV